MTRIKLSHLSKGEEFEIPWLETEFRKMVVLRLGECSVLVYGHHKLTGNSWQLGNFRLSPSTEVIPTGNFIEIKENSDGSSSVINTKNVSVDNDVKIPVVREPKVRERKNKVDVVFPDGEFSIKKLAESLKVEYHTVTNAFHKVRNQFKLVRTIPNGGRGKPISIWQKK